jgi:hypothetical protein
MIPGMVHHGGGADPPPGIPRSRLAEYADMTGTPACESERAPAPDKAQSPDATPPADPVTSPSPPPTGPVRSPATTAGTAFPPGGPVTAEDAARIARARREFAVLLGEFRRTAVLVPTDEGAPLTADFGGVRWIYAFSDETALARFAVARGEGGQEWPYRRVLGARLLDVAVPAAGVPCGVALDVAGGNEGVLFPPAAGVVPDVAAVDTGPGGDGEETE